MQIIALDEKDHRITAFTATRQENYRCMECGGILRLRGGKYKQLHFYHLRSPLLCKQKGKSLLHLHIQQQIQKILGIDESHLELHFPSIGRIADVAWVSRKIVFEIQCSFLPPQEVLDRVKDYALEGYHVIWIFHTKFFKRKSFLKEIAEVPHYFTNIHLRGGGGFFDRAREFRVPICLSQPKILDFTSVEEPWNHFLRNREKWPIHFKGDLLDLLPKTTSKPYPNLLKTAHYLYKSFLVSLIKKN